MRALDSGIISYGQGAQKRRPSSRKDAAVVYAYDSESVSSEFGIVQVDVLTGLDHLVAVDGGVELRFPVLE